MPKEKKIIESKQTPHYEDCSLFKGGWCNCARLEMQMSWAREELRRMKMPQFLQRMVGWYRPNTFPKL